MTERRIDGALSSRRSGMAQLGVADWLSLAAAPTFAIMAVLAVLTASPNDMLCSAMHGTSSLSGMAPMYVLMSVFHSAPWVRACCRMKRQQALSSGTA